MVPYFFLDYLEFYYNLFDSPMDIITVMGVYQDFFLKDLVGNVDVVSRCQHPPNDMSSRHVPTCCKNVGNVGPTFCQILSYGPCQTKWHVISGQSQPTCRLNLLDIKKNQHSFADNRTVMV